MNPLTTVRRAAFGAVLALGLPCAIAADAAAALDTAKIEQTIGIKGTFSKQENVFKISKPRTDVKVAVDHAALMPFMGLTSWAAFTPMGDGKAMLMGDTVVFEDEANPALDAALGAGLEVTALHNHFFFDQPKVYFMHIGGTGSAEQLAAGVKQVYSAIAAVRAAHPKPAAVFAGTLPTRSTIDAAALQSVFGRKGESKDGMFKVTIGREAKMHGTTVANEMGVNTWAGFAGSDSNAVVDGDFAMTEDELQPVLKAMRAAGINIVAIHQHMTHEEPRIMFLHYWGKGKAVQLAQGLKNALDVQAGIHK